MRQHQHRHRRRPAAIVLTAILVLSACASDPSDSGAAQASTAASTAASTDAAPSADEAETELDCERDGYPCTYAEVDYAVLQRQSEYVAQITAIVDAGSYTDALDWVRQQEDVVMADAHERAIVFRLAGGMPTFVSNGFEDEGVAAAGDAGSDIALAAMVAPTPEPVAAPPADAGVVGHDTPRGLLNPLNLKKALFLEPFALSLDSGFATARAELAKIPDYRLGGIEHLKDVLVTPDRFQGWRDYDAIFIHTHGELIGSQGALWTGVVEPKDPGATFEEQCDAMQNIVRNQLGRPDPSSPGDWYGIPGMTCSEMQHLGHWVRGVVMLDDLFAARYGRGRPSGLDKAVIYISGCGAMLMRLAEILAGTTSAFLGWDQRVYIGHIGAANTKFLDELITKRRTVGGALATACPNGCVMPTSGAMLRLHPNGAEPRQLRLYDLPRFADPKSPSSILEGGAQLDIIGTPGDGEDDELKLVVDFIGIIDPDDTGAGGLTSRTDITLAGARLAQDTSDVASKYNLRIYVDADEVAADNLGHPQHPNATVAPLGEDRYRYTVTAELGFDVEVAGRDVTLKVEVDPLPEGGISDYEVDVRLRGELSVCDIIEPVMGRIVTAFGEPVPLKEFFTPGLSSMCQVYLEGPGDSWAVYAVDLMADINIWRLPYVRVTSLTGPGGYEGPVTAVPSLGPEAVVIEVPNGWDPTGPPDPHVLFEYGGRVWQVTGSYPDTMEIIARGPDDVEMIMKLGETPVAAVVGVAEVLLERLRDVMPDGEG